MKINFAAPVAMSLLIASCSANFPRAREKDAADAPPNALATLDFSGRPGVDRGGPAERRLAADLAGFFHSRKKEEAGAPSDSSPALDSKGWPIIYGDNIYQGDGGPVELQLAGNLDNYASDIENLKDWMVGRMRGRARTDSKMQAAVAWAAKIMLSESDDLKARIYAADFLLKKDASPIAIAPPTMHRTISAEFPAGIDSPAQWKLAVARANLARGLAYLLEAKVSDATKAADLAAAQKRVAELRSRVEAAERDADQ